MNIEVRAKDRPQQSKLSIIDCDFHPRLTLEQLQAVPQQSMVELSADLRQSPAPRPGQGLQLSEDRAAGVAPRRLAAERRTAGQRRRLLPRAASRFLRHRLRHPEAAGSSTGNGDQNVELSIALASAANEGQLAYWTGQGAAAQALDRRALRGRRCLGRRSPQARRQQGVHAGVHAEQDRGGARPQALLADLRGRGRGRAAGRHPRLRLRRLAADQLRLSVVLHRGDDRARDLRAGHGHVDDHGGHLRALARAEDRADRMRLRLAAGARLAARQALEAAQGRGAASQDGAVGIHQEALLGDDPADGGDREPGSSARGDELDRLRPHHVLVATTRTGISTIRSCRCRRA